MPKAKNDQKETQKTVETPVETPTSRSTYQRLSDVSLRTSATALSIIFAYTFAVGKTAESGFKFFIVIIGLILFISILCSIACLIGEKDGEIRYIKVFSIISTALMVIAIGFTFLLLVSVLYSTTPNLLTICLSSF